VSRHPTEEIEGEGPASMSDVLPQTVCPHTTPWFRRWLLPRVGAFLIRLIRRSVRLRVHGRELVERFARDDTRYIHVFWHAHLLLMVYSYVGPRLLFLISRHRDGELIASIVERFGFPSSRGSSTRGGSAALREMIRELRRGSDIGFTPDGPKGPSRRVQPGTIAAARLAQAPIVPVAIGVSRAWRLNTWDRFVIPKPFSRVLMVYGEAIRIAREESVEAGCTRLERALCELEAFAAEHAADLSIGRRLS